MAVLTRTSEQDSYRTSGPVGANSSAKCSCQEGGFQLLVGDDGVARCRCPWGQNLIVSGDTASCEVCAPGLFSDSVGNEPCTSCSSHWGDAYRSAGPTEATSADACTCQEGGLQLLELNGTTACRCPPGEAMLVVGDSAFCQPCSEGSCTPGRPTLQHTPDPLTPTAPRLLLPSPPADRAPSTDARCVAARSLSRAGQRAMHLMLQLLDRRVSKHRA